MKMKPLKRMQLQAQCVQAFSGFSVSSTRPAGGRRLESPKPLMSADNAEGDVLSGLYLETNQIDDILPLVENPGLGGGDQVNLEDNPLSSESINVYIPELEARGVTVIYQGSSS